MEKEIKEKKETAGGQTRNLCFILLLLLLLFRDRVQLCVTE